MQIGIIGLPQAGKTTIFYALTRSRVKSIVGISHIAVVKVPDARLDALAKIFNPKKVVPANVTYVDVGGMIKGASAKGGLGEQFLNQMHKVDAALHIVRAFDLPQGIPTPKEDIEAVNFELVLSDLGMIEKKIEHIEHDLKRGKRDEEKLQALLKRGKESLEREKPLRSLEFTPEEKKSLSSFQFLSAKPQLLVLNVSEEKQNLNGDKFFANERGLVLCGKLEMELAQLTEEEEKEFLVDLGMAEPALNRVIRASYELLGLITFFTYVHEELRAWTLKAGSSVLQAAGTIHTDMERGFIKAEVVNFQHLAECGSLAKAKEKGHWRLEGRECVVNDGDVITVRFNV
ncbi:MAG: redox-regulated ATPase YchF [Candidatus Edwardsbacteria bacterium]